MNSLNPDVPMSFDFSDERTLQAIAAFQEFARVIAETLDQFVKAVRAWGQAVADLARRLVIDLEDSGVRVITAYSDDGGLVTGAVGPPEVLGCEYDEPTGLWLPVELPEFRLN